MLAWSPGTKGTPVTRRGDRAAEVQRQHRIREVAAEGEGQDRAALARHGRPAARRRTGTAGRRRRRSRAWTRSSPRCRRDWAASPDSTKLYRGTGYSLALGTGTLGMRLEKAGVAGMISSRTKLSGFTNPFSTDGGWSRPAADVAAVVVTPGPASARGGGPARESGRRGRRSRRLRRRRARLAPAAGARSRSSRRTTRSRRP